MHTDRPRPPAGRGGRRRPRRRRPRARARRVRLHPHLERCYAAGRFHAGLWSHGPGVLAVDYTETELCVLLEGRVRLANDEGSVEYEEGDAFVIAPGFRGTWESVGRVTKAYAILEP